MGITGSTWCETPTRFEARIAGSNNEKDVNDSWRYRDRVIAAFNRDLPCDQFFTAQIAGGLLDETLVIRRGEFGRTPTSEGTDSREHHPNGFSMWLAGGGVKRGKVHGATDGSVWHAMHDKVHIHDIHATILHLMGIEHTELTFRYSGRDYRLTDV